MSGASSLFEALLKKRFEFIFLGYMLFGITFTFGTIFYLLEFGINKNIDTYLDSILNFLKHIPKNKREIFQHTKIDVNPQSTSNQKDDFLSLLENGSTLSSEEIKTWENEIQKGYKTWKIEEF
jgi:hypothetical protein